MIPNIVFDFDGSLTDVAKESVTYYEAFTEKLAEILSIRVEDLEVLMGLGRSDILAEPEVYGWTVDGVIIAPATADPYLFTQATAQRVLKKYAVGGTVPPEDEWPGLFNMLFGYAYPKAGVFFRKYAFACVTRLNKWGKLTIVTNSSTANVERKINTLVGSSQTVKVVGDAKKFMLDPSWTEVPEKITPHGFPRPVYLRRKKYADVLNSLGDIDAVCGDIWELDLALPERFGIYTALVLSETTPAWEKDHYLNFENGISSASLEEITDYLLTA